jgi:hypothetical protein
VHVPRETTRGCIPITRDDPNAHGRNAADRKQVVFLALHRHLLFARCEASLANEDGHPLASDLVRFAQLGRGRPATGDPQRTTASLVPDAIDLAIGLATGR